MKLSNEGPSQGVRLSAEPRRPTLKEIREKWDPYAKYPSEQPVPISWGVVNVINDILLYLEGIEILPSRYIPEPRLGPQPKSEEDAIRRGKELAAIIRAAKEKLADSHQDEEPKLCTTSGDSEQWDVL